MKNKVLESIRNERRPVGLVSTLTVNYLHLRNPWVTGLWSSFFPGLGHLILGSYIKGFLLIGWEFFINTQAHINLGIMYSFLGQFDMAREVLDTRWALLYLSVWAFSIWESYSLTIDLNKLAVLGLREGSTTEPIEISSWDINFLDKRQPWMAAGISMLSPGLGHLYTHRIPTSFLLLTLTIGTVYFSHLLQAVHYSSLGKFALATAVLDPHCLLFIPSLYGFAIFDSYVNTVEYNKLFEQEQSRFLRNNYQEPVFLSRLMNSPKD